ncbi:MAG: RNA polymerase sigma factor [Massilibacteroides sp.]|nr:RNA polymerase sigma factor [Massilibacteroides sp.]MDD3062994.1 RNA polymerase sigma factor [Massilibacteroides sp.]MDD4115113.1 RNA polymerase sigma factor [Massilibacteroides sp.]MDD4660985.1 RNA polymerase sigma factor [Massilibacteroides sp.]
MNTENNTYLIDGCCRKDPKAQMELYEGYAKRLYMACFRIIGNTAEAEEAMQDAFLKIFTRISQYDRTKNFEVWMHRIAVNTAIDYVRKQVPLIEELVENRIEPKEEDDNDAEELTLSVEKVKKGITQLAPGYRLILTLYLFEGYDMEEIAMILKVKPSTIRTQYMRGKNKLVELMKG